MSTILHKGILAGMAMTMLFFSCSRPSSEEYYARTDEKGVYAFSLDLSDSLCCYDLDILAVLACGDRKLETFEGFPLNVTWMSPSGIYYAEEFWLTAASLEDRRHFSNRFFVPYREGLVPKEHGEWLLSIAVSPYFIREYSIPGLGLRLTRK